MTIDNKDWIGDQNGILEDHVIELRGDVSGRDYWLHARVKFDGCVHLHMAGNMPFSKEYGFHDQERREHACDAYIHICDLDDFIERLIKLREVAKKHFGKDWPE